MDNRAQARRSSERGTFGARGEGGAYGARGAHGEGGDNGERSQIVHLWLTKAEACRQLACSDRTLIRKVGRGEVERSQVGREGRYRILDRRAGRSPSVAMTSSPPSSPASSPPVASVALSRLMDRVEQLTERVRELERSDRAAAGAADLAPEPGERDDGPLRVPLALQRWASEISLRAGADPEELLARAVRIGLEELGEAYPDYAPIARTPDLDESAISPIDDRFEW